MKRVHRVLDHEVVRSLDQYTEAGGAAALATARDLDPATIVELIAGSGLRGRGGAGFPTGTKWRTVAASHSAVVPTTVVVNAAEGEPGTFKDRAILRTNPYRVLEGAVIAALAVHATFIRIGIKASFHREVQRLQAALTEARAAGWFEGIDIALVLGPDSYLFGEETAMLEVMEGRQPFPRVTPPFRRGIEADDTRSAGGVDLAVEGGAEGPPALVDNVETLANVPLIVAHGIDWFRELGTEESPGTIVCTITGATRREGVAELPMGTTLRDAIATIGWGPQPDRHIGVVLSGVANPLIPASLLDTPLTYEAMRAAGLGLGSAGFIVFDDATDPVAIARGVSRFLAVESCGQCVPCKSDGLTIAEHLAAAQDSAITDAELEDLRRRVQTVSIGARCNLARQQEDVIGSLLSLFGDIVDDHVVRGLAAASPASPDAAPIVPIVELTGGRAVLDTEQLTKQPDWSYDDSDSGTAPADLLGDTPVHIDVPIRNQRWDGWTSETRDDHPLETIDEAHDLLDRLLAHALDTDTEHEGATTAELAHVVRVHIDVTRRILYPMARRYGEDTGEELADAIEEREDLMTALVSLLEQVELPTSQRVATLRALGTELRRHSQDEEAILELLGTTMDVDERETLADGLDEARATSRAR